MTSSMTNLSIDNAKLETNALLGIKDMVLAISTNKYGENNT